MPLSVAPATKDDMVVIANLATGFEAESCHVKVDPAHSVENYHKFDDLGIGGMLALWDGDTIIGGLGYIISGDLHFKRKMAIETFWYVDPSHRGGGIRLLVAFENLATERGCDYVAMVHMVDSHPDSLEKLYLHRDYKLAEKHYMKEIKP